MRLHIAVLSAALWAIQRAAALPLPAGRAELVLKRHPAPSAEEPMHQLEARRTRLGMREDIRHYGYEQGLQERFNFPLWPFAEPPASLNAPPAAHPDDTPILVEGTTITYTPQGGVREKHWKSILEGDGEHWEPFLD